MSRRKFIAGNWKENLTLAEGRALVAELLPLVKDCTAADFAVCPTLLSVAAIADAAKGSPLMVGAQNAFSVEADGKLVQSGAYTGEVSPAMVKDAGAQWVILGHSERRQYFGETDEKINAKARACYEAGLKPIICIGETLGERELGITASVIDIQVRTALHGLPADKVAESVLAYEPVWAIGTGKTATPEMAQEVHGQIRALLTELFGGDTAAAVRIQYGGSMKPGNAAELMAQPDIDGGLIGGASLKAKDFAEIIKAAL